VKRPGAVEVGCRVFIRVPTARDRDGFLALMRSSRGSLRPWVEPPADHAAFAAYLKRTRRPTERGFFVCRRKDRVIAGVINLSQIFHGAFQSAYLGFYAGASFMGKGYMSEGLSPRYLKVFGRWRDHERWAITVENLRR
jgi:ribosomal-protein-alanine N-acetyltransferase